MKIVFFGSSVSAIPALEKISREGYKIELIITQPDKPSGRGKRVSFSPVKKFALDRGIPVHQPGKIRTDEDVLEKLKTIKPELNVVIAYGQIIPSSIIYFPRFKSMNVHFSLLPKYRGAAPVQWALLNGEKKTGITIIELNEKMDEGDILAQEEVEVLPQENAEELENRLAETGANLLMRTIAQIGSIMPRKQDPSLATYAPRLKKEDGKISWTEEANSIERKARAFFPWPSSYTFFRGKQLKIIKGQSLLKKIPGKAPGEIVEINREGIQVSCGKNSVFRIDILHPEGKKAMDAYTFTLGARVQPGDKLE